MNRTIRLLSASVMGFTLSISSVQAMGIKFGLKAGVNMSNYYGKDAKPGAGESKKSLTGPVGGGFLLLDLPGNLDVQGEILYSSKGSTMEGGGINVTETIAYLEVPVLAKYGIPTPGLVKPSLFAGPAFGNLLSAKSRFEAMGQSEDLRIKDRMKTTDVGVAMGASVLLRKILLDLRYTLGLTTTVKPDPDTGESVDVKNNAISASLGVSF